MTGTGFIIDKLSGACFAKSFGCSSICFYLWHLFFSFFVKIDGVSNHEFRLTPPENLFNQFISVKEPLPGFGLQIWGFVPPSQFLLFLQ
jgi:hypothetical protein